MVTILRKKNEKGKLSPKKALHIKDYVKKNGIFLNAFRYTKNQGKLALKNVLLSRSLHIGFKVFSIAVLCLLFAYGAYRYINSSVGNDVVVSKSEIIARVAKLTQLPSEEPGAVVRVENPEILKKQNSFYENVKVGDYILMYPSVAIIYDLMNNTVVSVKKMDPK